MNKTGVKNLSVILLLLVTIAIIFVYILYLRRQVVVLSEQNQNLLVNIEKGKIVQQRLEQEKGTLKQDVEASKKELEKLLTEYNAEKAALDEMQSKLGLAQVENQSLRQENERVAKEIESLQAKLNSIDELKKAIAELRSHGRRVSGVATSVQQKSGMPKPIESEGNRGYLVKEGKSTYPPRIKVEVVPASFQ